MQSVLNKLARVVAQVAPTTRLGVCPSPGNRPLRTTHVKASSEALFGFVDDKSGDCLELWLCSECQGLFYTRDAGPPKR